MPDARGIAVTGKYVSEALHYLVCVDLRVKQMHGYENPACVSAQASTHIVACWSAETTCRISENRHSRDIQRTPADTFVGLSLLAYAERYDRAFHFIRIEAAYRATGKQ